MRPGLTCMLLAASFAALSSAVPAADTNWFFGATSLNGSRSATRTSRPDYLGGATQAAMHCGADGRGIPGSGVWLLTKYDRVHQIALAVASTDQCSAALFKAPPPGIPAPDADLSAYRTGTRRPSGDVL